MAHDAKLLHGVGRIIHLEQGGQWAETDMGTNAIGTAIAALQPTLERRQKGLISDGRISCLNKVPFAAWPARLSQLVPNASTELVVDYDHEIGAILVLHKLRRKSVPTIKREEMQAALARERQMFTKRRTIELAKANEVLRGCLDALAAVPNLTKDI